jgi:hypothetical protein
MARPQLVTVESDPRADLIAAKHAAVAARTRVTNLEAGIAEVRRRTNELHARQAAAVTAAKDAQAAHAEAMAVAAGSGRPIPKLDAPSFKEHDSIVYELNTLADAGKYFAIDLKAARSDAEHAEREVERCISSILVPHAEEVLAKGLALTRELIGVRQLLFGLACDSASHSIEASIARSVTHAPLAAVEKEIGDWLSGPFRGSTLGKSPDNPFLLARHALRQDSQADIVALFGE